MSNFIWPDDLTTLSIDECQLLLADIRERRAKIGDSIASLKKVTAKLNIGQVQQKIEKELFKYKKSMDKADKAISEVEKALSNLAAYRLQLEDATGE